MTQFFIGLMILTKRRCNMSKEGLSEIENGKVSSFLYLLCYIYYIVLLLLYYYILLSYIMLYIIILYCIYYIYILYLSYIYLLLYLLILVLIKTFEIRFK